MSLQIFIRSVEFTVQRRDFPSDQGNYTNVFRRFNYNEKRIFNKIKIINR